MFALIVAKKTSTAAKNMNMCMILCLVHYAIDAERAGGMSSNDRIRDSDLASLIAWAEVSNDLVLRALLELQHHRKNESGVRDALKVAFDFRCEWHDCRRWTHSPKDEFCYFHKIIFEIYESLMNSVR